MNAQQQKTDRVRICYVDCLLTTHSTHHMQFVFGKNSTAWNRAGCRTWAEPDYARPYCSHWGLRAEARGLELLRKKKLMIKLQQQHIMTTIIQLWVVNGQKYKAKSHKSTKVNENNKENKGHSTFIHMIDQNSTSPLRYGRLFWWRVFAYYQLTTKLTKPRKNKQKNSQKLTPTQTNSRG